MGRSAIKMPPGECAEDSYTDAASVAVAWPTDGNGDYYRYAAIYILGDPVRIRFGDAADSAGASDSALPGRVSPYVFERWSEGDTHVHFLALETGGSGNVYIYPVEPTGRL